MREQEPVMARLIQDGMRIVLNEIRDAVLPPTGPPNMAAWSGRSLTWQRLITGGAIADLIAAIIDYVLTLGMRRQQPPATPSVAPLLVPATGTEGRVSSLAYAQQHLRVVESRLREWPQEAWAEVRDELDAGIAAGLDARALRERVGDALNVTALTRVTEDEMDALYDRIEQGVPPAVEASLRARIRELADTADRSRRRWEWRADRIARTEVAGAVNAGVDAFARESTAATGREWYKRWWTSQDDRVRATHRAAHGQVVPPGGRFSVGGATLRYPGDPLGPPQEVINCRCSTLLITRDEAEETNG